MRKILALRKMDIDERLEQETLLKTYKNALGIINRWSIILVTDL